MCGCLVHIETMRPKDSFDSLELELQTAVRCPGLLQEQKVIYSMLSHPPLQLPLFNFYITSTPYFKF